MMMNASVATRITAMSAIMGRMETKMRNVIAVITLCVCIFGLSLLYYTVNAEEEMRQAETVVYSHITQNNEGK